jgi:hypothetical protein
MAVVADDRLRETIEATGFTYQPIVSTETTPFSPKQ